MSVCYSIFSGNDILPMYTHTHTPSLAQWVSAHSSITIFLLGSRATEWVLLVSATCFWIKEKQHRETNFTFLFHLRICCHLESIFTFIYTADILSTITAAGCEQVPLDGSVEGHHVRQT